MKEQYIPIPKHLKSFVKCIEMILYSSNMEMFQSDIKRKCNDMSWYEYIKPEIEYWNRIISSLYHDYTFITFTVKKNPKTCRKNEILVQFDHRIKVEDRGDYFLITIIK